MADLLDKLNTLLRANLNSLLSGTGSREEGSRPRLTPDKLGGDVDREIAALRKQVDDALRDEDTQRSRLEAMQQQLVDLDQEIDRLLERGQDEQARQLSAQLKRQQQKASMVEADLERHRQATFDLIQHVNTLEALVSDARRNQAEQASAPPATQPSAEPFAASSPRLAVEPPPSITRSIPVSSAKSEPAAPPTPPTPPAPSAPAAPAPPPAPAPAQSVQPPASTEPPMPQIVRSIPIKVSTGPAPEATPTPPAPAEPMSEADKAIQAVKTPMDKLSDMLRGVRERVEQSIAAPTPDPDSIPDRPVGSAAPKPDVSTREIDDDLAKRRARLSKPE